MSESTLHKNDPANGMEPVHCPYEGCGKPLLITGKIELPELDTPEMEKYEDDFEKHYTHDSIVDWGWKRLEIIQNEGKKRGFQTDFCRHCWRPLWITGTIRKTKFETPRAGKHLLGVL